MPPIRYQNLVFDSARWEGFDFRPDDIVIGTPPKCGTTWTQMTCALLVLGITVPEALWPQLVAAARFDNMRKRADEFAPDTTNAIWNDNQRFFNRGCSGQWHDILDDDDLVRYEQRVAEVAPPDLVHWAHAGTRSG